MALWPRRTSGRGHGCVSGPQRLAQRPEGLRSVNMRPLDPVIHIRICMRVADNLSLQLTPGADIRQCVRCGALVYFATRQICRTPLGFPVETQPVCNHCESLDNPQALRNTLLHTNAFEVMLTEWRGRS